ncbi:hypothetical protein A4A49_51950 [Nicotiana attenuata]|uniref:CCHC-type domain-containing protein n=1 Tax=Nicotiana attenuata TaxID=49451 RepID=A0A314KRR3_NICAT|nr:hypothetical protein A4A49_51950 [Nicotiana attenuata]
MKVYQDNLAKSTKCTPRWNGETGYEIEDPKYKHVVSLVNMTCNCRAWQLTNVCRACHTLHIGIKDAWHTKKNKKREETEHPKSGKLSRRGMEMTCSLCGICGHNKRGCPSKKTGAGNDVPTGTPLSVVGRGRGRGNGRGTSTTTTSSSQSARGRGVAAIGRGV